MTSVLSKIIPFGERGWLAQLSADDDPISSGLRANAIADLLRSEPGIDDALAGIDSVAIRFDPVLIAPETAKAVLEKAASAPPFVSARDIEPVIMPVCYGGAIGPDLAELADSAGLTEDQVIAIHSQPIYYVATLGFAPGFAYMGMLNDALRTPRLASPRLQVDAGSVGVAGAFTGIYPLPSPGGWRIIGQTPRTLYEPSAATPFLLSAGKPVKFQPISSDEFERWPNP